MILVKDIHDLIHCIYTILYIDQLDLLVVNSQNKNYFRNMIFIYF